MRRNTLRHYGRTQKYEVAKNQVPPWILLHMNVRVSLVSDQPFSFRKGFEVKAPVSSLSKSRGYAKGKECALLPDIVR
jgi:hypothetical protein